MIFFPSFQPGYCSTQSHFHFECSAKKLVGPVGMETGRSTVREWEEPKGACPHPGVVPLGFELRDLLLLLQQLLPAGVQLLGEGGELLMRRRERGGAGQHRTILKEEQNTDRIEAGLLLNVCECLICAWHVCSSIYSCSLGDLVTPSGENRHCTCGISVFNSFLYFISAP